MNKKTIRLIIKIIIVLLSLIGIGFGIKTFISKEYNPLTNIILGINTLLMIILIIIEAKKDKNQ